MSRKRMIRFDRCPVGVVVYCAECTFWSAFTFTMLAAHETASSHEERAHPGDYRARNAAQMYKRRHAVAPSNV